MKDFACNLGDCKGIHFYYSKLRREIIVTETSDYYLEDV